MHDKEFFIRPAINEDVYFIKNVVFTVLFEYGLKPDENGKDSDLNDIELNYSSNGGFFGVLIYAGSQQIVGTFGLFPADPKLFELRKMYLLKEFRGRGLGKYMQDSILKIAMERRVEKLILETISPLKEAISLYRKYGFKEIRPLTVTDRVNQAFELNLSY